MTGANVVLLLSSCGRGPCMLTVEQELNLVVAIQCSEVWIL